MPPSKTIVMLWKVVSASTQLNESSAVFIKLVFLVKSAWEFFEEKLQSFNNKSE